MYSESFKLAIDCGNDAFADGNAPSEVARILRELADGVDAGFTRFPVLLDSNGNNCGNASFIFGK